MLFSRQTRPFPRYDWFEARIDIAQPTSVNSDSNLYHVQGEARPLAPHENNRIPLVRSLRTRETIPILPSRVKRPSSSTVPSPLLSVIVHL